MIKTNELRKGNLVGFMPHKEIIPCPIQVIGYDNAVVTCKGSVLQLFEKDMHPIPITADWFERLGFEKYSGIAYIYRYTPLYKNDPADRNSVIIWNLAESPDKPIWVTNNQRCRVQTIHQLQNLIFAITGEELTIKKHP